MSAQMHRHTPTIVADDPRGLHVRTTRYRRISADAQPQALCQRQCIDAAERKSTTWDARSVATLVVWQSLSGATVASHGADAGVTITLHDAASMPVATWNGRGWQQRVAYDDQLRPNASFEKGPMQDERCLERLSYGGPDAHSSNGCGELLQHDDAAGTQTTEVFSIHGHPMVQTRRFLGPGQEPDWPDTPDARHALLEPDAYTTQWRHDAAGLSLCQRDARGNTQTSRYAIDGSLREHRLRVANGIEQMLVAQTVFGPMGELLAQTSGNGVVSTAGYDPASGLLRFLRAERADGKLLQDLGYEYDPAGNLLVVRDGTAVVKFWRGLRSDGDRTYSYDTLYQLIEAHGLENASARNGPDLPAYGDPGLLTPYTQMFEYDDAGNLTTLRQHGARPHTLRMVVAADSNRSLHWPDGMPEPDLASGFDACGNQVAMEGGKGLAWNGRNQLRTVTTVSRSGAANDEEFYAYDGTGTRSRKTGTEWVQGAFQSKDVRYLPGLELRINSRDGEELDVIDAVAGLCHVHVLYWHSTPPSDIANGQFRYQLADQLGAVTVELDATARLISAEGYYPFGSTAWRSTNNAREADYRTVRYSGKERDASGLYYYGFRYYAPWQCRWTQADPAGSVDGPNLYLFVRNSPVGHYDSYGLYTTELKLIWIVFGLLVSFIAAIAMRATVPRTGPARGRVKSSEKRERQERIAISWMTKNFARTPLVALQSERLRSFLIDSAHSGRMSFHRGRTELNAPLHVLALTPSEDIRYKHDLSQAADLGDFAKQRGLHFTSVELPVRRGGGSSSAPTSSRQSSSSSLEASGAGTSNARSSMKRRPAMPLLSAMPSSSGSQTTSPGASTPLTFSQRFRDQLSALKTQGGPELAKVEKLLTHFREGGVPDETVRVEGFAGLTGSSAVPGFGHTGRGAYRLITTGNQAGRHVEGIGDPHHASGKGYGKVAWWR